MKKTFACVAGAIALLSGFGVWSNLSQAQVPGQPGGQPVRPASTNPPAPATQPQTPMSMPGTRVAVVNINKVLKDYQKAQSLNNAIKNDVQQYATKMDGKRKDLTNLQTELAKPTILPQQRDQIEKQILVIQRDLQDLDNDARKVIGKKRSDIAVQIFREIEAVVKSVAVSQGFDLVLAYPDGTTPEEVYSEQAIVNKLASQAAMPLFYKPQIDLTMHIIATLNYNYPAPGGTVQPAGGAPPPNGR